LRISISPAHRPPAQAQRFHDGFLGRKAGGQPGAARVGGLRPFIFCCCKDAGHERITPPVERLLDPPHLHNIDPNTPNLH